jgi:site-specific DNA-methyltransferase (adenine-specific)
VGYADRVVEADAVSLAASLEDSSVSLVWTDPPFGTGNVQRVVSSGHSYSDGSVDDLLGVCGPLADELHRVLRPDGVVAVCLDYRAVHQFYCLMIEHGFFPHGEVVWTFGLGRGASRWWANKHNTVLLFGKGKDRPRFNEEFVPMVTRKSPGKGYFGDKKVSSVWDITMSNTAAERVGYPNQKPESLIDPFVLVHTGPGDLVFDPFGGSGTTAAVAQRLGRSFVTGDINPVAVSTMRKRLGVEE